MMDNVIEKREKIKQNVYYLELEISKKDFFTAYDQIDIHSGYDFLKKYLVYKIDCGIPERLETNYTYGEELLTISTKLHYLEKEDEDCL